MSMSKVFSKDKWYEVMSTKIWPKYMKRIPPKEQAFTVSKWVHRCEGLTFDEIKAIGYDIDEEWFVEVC